MKNTTYLYDYFFVLENLSDGLFIVDNNRVITFWNKAAEKILGYRAEEIIGKPVTILKTPHVHPKTYFLHFSNSADFLI